MNHTIILEKFQIAQIKDNYVVYLNFEKYLIEENFHWLKVEIIGNTLVGKGQLKIGCKNYDIQIYYSPFFNHRFDRIYVNDHTIIYNHAIHLYSDLSLCLYHPAKDKPRLRIIPLVKMIPWISEWCIFFEKWKEYGVWLGKEIKHT